MSAAMKYNSITMFTICITAAIHCIWFVSVYTTYQSSLALNSFYHDHSYVWTVCVEPSYTAEITETFEDTDVALVACTNLWA